MSAKFPRGWQPGWNCLRVHYTLCCNLPSTVYFLLSSLQGSYQVSSLQIVMSHQYLIQYLLSEKRMNGNTITLPYLLKKAGFDWWKILDESRFTRNFPLVCTCSLITKTLTFYQNTHIFSFIIYFSSSLFDFSLLQTYIDKDVPDSVFSHMVSYMGSRMELWQFLSLFLLTFVELFSYYAACFGCLNSWDDYGI